MIAGADGATSPVTRCASLAELFHLFGIGVRQPVDDGLCELERHVGAYPVSCRQLCALGTATGGRR
jgi:hypothetical protein